MYKIISLFSGCGGFDLGFCGNFKTVNQFYKKNNFEIIFANDIDKNACLTYSQNFQHNIICSDVNELIAKNQIPNKTDIVIGGFPCQDFSHSGKRLGLNAKRGTLYQAMIEVIKISNPKIFIAENVKGLLTINKGDAIKTIIKDFGEAGYKVSYQLLHAADYEVPQNRERVVIVGVKKNLPDFAFPKPILDNQNWLKSSDAIKDLEQLNEGGTYNHYWSKAKMFVGTQGNKIINPDLVAPTMRAEHHGNIEFHYNGMRRLSAREAARFQTFPDDFIFYPSTSSAYKQIGNAVPPVLGWHIARAAQDYLEKNI